nr:DUF6240 domain-containing protein [uncultured Catonella sp.]
MQINMLKDNVKVIEPGLKDIGKEVKKTGNNDERVSIGEAFNKNIRTKVMTYGDTVNKLKEEDRELSKFKEKAEKAIETLEYNAKTVTSEVMKELEKEGVSAEDSDADLVKKSIENIVKNREIRKENLTKQAEKLSENAEQIKKISYSAAGNEALARQLERTGMAVTKENIEKLAGAAEFAKEVVENINESALSRMIEADLPETISNIYMAEHSESYTEISGIEKSEETWVKIETQAVNLLENKGITADEESLGAAKWLFIKGMEITPATVAKYLSLNELKAEAGSAEGIENLTTKLAKGLSEGKDALNTAVGTANTKEASYVVNYFKHTAEFTITEVTQRRILEEIRLKLTEESAVNMLNKGIKIDLTDLKGLVENLRKEEESYYKNLLEGAKTLEKEEISKYLQGKDLQENNIVKKHTDQINLLRSVASIRSYAITREYDSDYKMGAVSEVYKQETKINLSAYHEAGLAYEKGATEVRADLGDSLRKAFGNIDEVLKENKLELTELNKKAVKLLAYNKAEVNMESVTKMKSAYALTEAALKELKPATVAGLIKSGINPLDMDMEELLKAAKEINEKIIPSDEKYSRYLYKLEKAGEVSETERKAYIGIYRLLNQIEKGDDAAVGSVSLTDRSLTLRNMLSAVRTRKLGGFNEKTDENFGELVRVFDNAGKIDAQIDTAYAKLLAGELKESLSEPENAYYEDKKAEMIREFNVADIEKLIDENAEITFSNIAAQTDISKGRRNLLGLVSEMSSEEKRKVNNLSYKFIDEFDGDRFAAENEKAVTDALSKKVTKIMENEKMTYDKLNGILAIKKTITLSVKREESKTYDIPFIYDEDKLADLSITIRKGKSEADKGKVFIVLTTNDDKVTSEFRIVNERITGYFRAESRENLENLKVHEDILKKTLSEMNMEIGEISYHLSFGTSQITNSDDIYNDNIKTSDIYRTAKTVTTHVLKVLGIREQEMRAENENK